MTSLRAALAIWTDALRALATQALFVAGVLLPLFLVAGLVPALIYTVEVPLPPPQKYWAGVVVGAVMASAVYALIAALCWARRVYIYRHTAHQPEHIRLRRPQAIPPSISPLAILA
ncbi:hypothetical protein SAMN05444149_101214 [Pseudosulfitobacter pseudonitzschiae]|uniref:Uncharacterized protein n=1 Tax=Pseudosulfitobacter pseudonitzschiae TaxID=1402135 RepID=A0A073J8R7_9RHOB|nr:hypothetical protein [Pseudosulfitobacter pseudonitzschiae]KEJ98081.1 hypothetical protein SUH3_03550 [Pseudosulfitobacter pseudonitzschiae]QKS09324.1 hypothetical protein HT745_13005 [Pseudosulfitobacter pseudonitzschiae]SHE47831.1 hypothetical protein SAMN05444149_101214 [Pseudosulfitobacter pseudonitzschiae]